MMSEQYRLMIYAAIASLHFYRDELTADAGETLGEYAKRNDAVVQRIIEEIKNTFHYELSGQQVGSALSAYLTPSCKLSDPVYDPLA